MKTFEDRLEFLRILNEMWKIFSLIAQVEIHAEEIRRYDVLKNQASELLVRDVIENEA